MNIIEYFRKRSIISGLQTETMLNIWPTWKNVINETLGESPDAQRYFELGNSLYEIFQSTNPSGEDNQCRLVMTSNGIHTPKWESWSNAPTGRSSRGE